MERYFMHPETGTIGTYDEWYYDVPDIDGNYGTFQRNAVDAGEVYEVVKAHTDDPNPASNIKQGDWIARRAWEEYSRNEMIIQEGLENVEAAEKENCFYTCRHQHGEVSEYVGDYNEEDGSHLRVIYLVPEDAFYRPDGEEIEDLGEIPWSKYIAYYQWRN